MENILPTAVTLGHILASAGWALVGVLIFWAGTRLFDWLDPIDYKAEIEKGNVAAAIKLSAVIVALAGLVIVSIL